MLLIRPGELRADNIDMDEVLDSHKREERSLPYFMHLTREDGEGIADQEFEEPMRKILYNRKMLGKIKHGYNSPKSARLISLTQPSTNNSSPVGKVLVEELEFNSEKILGRKPSQASAMDSSIIRKDGNSRSKIFRKNQHSIDISDLKKRVFPSSPEPSNKLYISKSDQKIVGKNFSEIYLPKLSTKYEIISKQKNVMNSAILFPKINNNSKPSASQTEGGKGEFISELKKFDQIIRERNNNNRGVDPKVSEKREKKLQEILVYFYSSINFGKKILNKKIICF